jgi:hypothetical protein
VIMPTHLASGLPGKPPDSECLIGITQVSA